LQIFIDKTESHRLNIDIFREIYTDIARQKNRPGRP
jgi:hypothetical protein